MTTPNGPVLFNSSSGSDTDSSGLGPASAVTGYGAELDGTATIDVSMDGADLTTMSAGDLLFCSTSSGRQFSIIASVDTINETITTDDLWPIESGVAWAVGGKRATYENSRSLTSSGDVPLAWLETETDQTITSSLGEYAKGGRFRGAAGSMPTLSIDNDGSFMWQGGSRWIVNLKMQALSVGNKFSNAQTSGGIGNTSVTCQDCVIGDPTNSFTMLSDDHARTSYITASNTLIQYVGTVGASNITENSTALSLTNCVWKLNGIIYKSGPNGNFSAKKCIFIGDGTGAFYSHNYGKLFVEDCVFYNHNIVCSGGQLSCSIKNCIFHTCATAVQAYYGGTLEDAGGTVYGNYAYNVTSLVAAGDTDGQSSLENTTLSADPFTDAANDDFTLNTVVGGGAVLRAIVTAFGSTTTYPFNWLTDGSGGGGGGGSTVHPLYAN